MIYGVSLCLGMIAVLVSGLSPVVVTSTVILVLAVFIYVGIRAGLVSVCSKHVHHGQQYFDVKQ